MKRVFKIAGIILLVVVVLNNAVFCICRHGWKLFGFDMCENPDRLYLENVYVTDNNVHIIGNTTSSATSFVGYTYKIKDDILYIGIKENLLLGFNRRTGGYSFVIEDDFTNIESIWLVDDSEGKCIWTLQTDKKWMEKIQRIRLYETVSVEKDANYKLKTLNADFVYADDELLERIRHAEFSDELYISKGAGYLGIAELENGQELYLEFERHYDDYHVIGKWGHYSY